MTYTERDDARWQTHAQLDALLEPSEPTSDLPYALADFEYERLTEEGGQQ